MRIDEIVLGKEYRIAKTGFQALNTLDKGELVRAEYKRDSIVTNEPTYVVVRVVDKNSEKFDIQQTVFPHELKEDE